MQKLNEYRKPASNSSVDRHLRIVYKIPYDECTVVVWYDETDLCMCVLLCYVSLQ